MRDYIVTRECVTSRIQYAIQADAPTSPALSLARKVNRRGITKTSETANDYTRSQALISANHSLQRIKRRLINCIAVLRSLQCDLLISRSHCNEFRYLHVCSGGEAA
jgi:hypothetical protein